MSSHATEKNSIQEKGEFPQPAEATDRFVTVNGLRLHLLDYGAEPTRGDPLVGNDGRPVLLCVHGSAATAHWFDYVATDLCRDYRVLSLDQRGHGDSEWANDADYTYARYGLDLAGLVEQLGYDNVVLVGHSMGGMVSLGYAATKPAKIGKLVIVDTTMKMTDERVSMMRGVGSRPGRSYPSQDDFVANYRLRPASAIEHPPFLRHIAETGCRRFEDGQWRNKFDRNVYAKRVVIEGIDFWQDIGIPALYIKGGLSDRMNDALEAEIQKRCPHIEFAEVPNATHHVTLDNPNGFNIALRQFLN
jgi:pimeloyl-ACP methyl ester carboxylesterase